MRRAYAAGNETRVNSQYPHEGQGQDSVIEGENDRLTEEFKGKIQSLKSISIQIGDEVRSQNTFLKEMDNQFDSSGGFLGKAMDGVKKLAKSGSRNYILYLILFSFVVFLFLWILVR